MQSIMLHQITTDEFNERLRTIIKEEIKLAIQNDLVLSKEGVLKMGSITDHKKNASFYERGVDDERFSVALFRA